MKTAAAPTVFECPAASSVTSAKCSLDAVMKKYRLDDPALLELAKIVRGADTPDES